MARKALIVKAQKQPKYSVRQKNRCALCGRGRGYMRQFGICRICFREQTAKGAIPGVKKASW